MNKDEFFKACEEEFKNCDVLALAVLNHPKCPAWLVNKIIIDYSDNTDAYEVAIGSDLADVGLVLDAIGKDERMDFAIAGRSEPECLIKILEYYKNKPNSDYKADVFRVLSMNLDMPVEFVNELFRINDMDNDTITCNILKSRNCTNDIRLKVLDHINVIGYWILDILICPAINNEVVKKVAKLSASLPHYETLIKALMNRPEPT
jgi:hypothetical protein